MFKVKTSSCSRDQLEISGTEHIVKRIQEMVEVIRNMLKKAYEKEDPCIILLITYCFDFYLREPSQYTLVIGSSNDKAHISKDWFNDYMRVGLNSLMKQLGSTCQNILFIQETRRAYYSSFPPSNEIVEALKIEWNFIPK